MKSTTLTLSERASDMALNDFESPSALIYTAWASPSLYKMTAVFNPVALIISLYYAPSLRIILYLFYLSASVVSSIDFVIWVGNSI